MEKSGLTDIFSYSKELALDFVAELIPGWLHLNSREDFGLKYMSPNMEADFNITMEEVRKIGVQFLIDAIHPESSARVIPQLQDLVKKGDPEKMISFYQYIRLPGKDYTWYLTSTKLYDENNVISISFPVNTLKDFDGKINQVLTENILIKENLQKFDELTHREQQIFTLAINGKNNQEIAANLNISALTIKTHRQNISKKLNTGNLNDWFKIGHAFGLIEFK